MILCVKTMAVCPKGYRLIADRFGNGQQPVRYLVHSGFLKINLFHVSNSVNSSFSLASIFPLLQNQRKSICPYDQSFLSYIWETNQFLMVGLFKLIPSKQETATNAKVSIHPVLHKGTLWGKNERSHFHLCAERKVKLLKEWVCKQQSCFILLYEAAKEDITRQ